MKHQAKLAGQARHILTAVGVYLVASGKADEATIEQIIGGVLALASLVMSWTSKAKRVGEGDLP